MPRQNISPSDYPQAILKQIEQLALNIVIARKRRGESQAQWAKKLGISQPTMVRIERGDPSVAMASYVMCIWLINPSAGLAELIAPLKDHAALEKEVARVSAKRKPSKPSPPHSMRTPQTLSADAPFAKASIFNPPELAHLRADPMADIRKSLGSAAALSEVARLRADPMADIRKSLERTSESSEAAKGLAALIAKPAPKKNG